MDRERLERRRTERRAAVRIPVVIRDEAERSAHVRRGHRSAARDRVGRIGRRIGGYELDAVPHEVGLDPAVVAGPRAAERRERHRRGARVGEDVVRGADGERVLRYLEAERDAVVVEGGAVRVSRLRAEPPGAVACVIVVMLCSGGRSGVVAVVRRRDDDEVVRRVDGDLIVHLCVGIVETEAVILDLAYRRVAVPVPVTVRGAVVPARDESIGMVREVRSRRGLARHFRGVAVPLERAHGRRVRHALRVGAHAACHERPRNVRRVPGDRARRGIGPYDPAAVLAVRRAGPPSVPHPKNEAASASDEGVHGVGPRRDGGVPVERRIEARNAVHELLELEIAPPLAEAARRPALFRGETIRLRALGLGLRGELPGERVEHRLFRPEVENQRRRNKRQDEKQRQPLHCKEPPSL